MATCVDLAAPTTPCVPDTEATVAAACVEDSCIERAGHWRMEYLGKCHRSMVGHVFKSFSSDKRLTSHCGLR